MRQGTRIKSLDDFKWAAAFLVVAIHTSPLESVNMTADFLLTRVIARTAVPFFFMVTGYFVLGRAYLSDDMAGIKRFLKQLCTLYFWVTLLYLPVQAYRFLRGGWAQAADSPLVRAGKLFWQLLQAVFFDGTYYHLWYLPAVGLGLILAFWGLQKLGERGALAGAGLLYLAGLLGDSYYGLTERVPVLRACYEGFFRLFSYTRNGLFFAPLFLLLGCRAALQNEEKKPAGTVEKLCTGGLLLCMCGEGLLLHSAGWQRHDSMYLLLPAVMTGLFSLLLSAGEKKRAGGLPAEPKRRAFYSQGPMLLYCVHPAGILAVRGAAKITGWNFLYRISPLYYLLVTGGSLFLIWLLLAVRLRGRE